MNSITNLHQDQNEVIVSMGYDNTTTNITLTEGYGTILPDPSVTSYNLVWWNVSDYLNPTDDPSVEVVKCIAKLGDTLVIMRSQQQTLASPKNIPGKLYNMALLPDTLHDSNLDTNLNTLSYYNIPQTHGISAHTGIIGDHSTNLSNVGTNTHAQIDAAITTSIGHIAASGTSVHSLGTVSIQSADNVTITGGYITGITSIGIGTVSPGTRLDIQYGASSDQLRLCDQDGSLSYKIGRNGVDGLLDFEGQQSSYTGYHFKGYGGASRLYIRGSDGNVGIGTAVPQNKLDVQGNPATIGISVDNTRTVAKLYSSGSDGYIELFTGETPPVSRIKLSAIGDSYISNGNVGIGTMAPGGKLELKGTGNHLVITDEASVNKQWIMRVVGSGLDINEPGFGSRLFVKEGGNVGIGITTPTSLLDVNGTVQLRGIIGGTGLTVDAGGNVGIGTTNPNADLDVQGQIELSAYYENAEIKVHTQDGARIAYDDAPNVVKSSNSTP